MPSPIAHSAVGYIIYKVTRRRQEGGHSPQEQGGPEAQPRKQLLSPGLLLLVSLVASLLPDGDVALAVLGSSMLNFHNNWTHSLFTGLVVALIASGLLAAGLRAMGRPANFLSWFIVVLVGYELHVLMDFFTHGRGVMLFWPLSAERHPAPLEVFYGVRWSEGWLSAHHLVTLINELLFVSVLFLVVRFVWGKLDARRGAARAEARGREEKPA